MVRYFNIKGNYGVETVDEINSAEFKTFKEFKIELKRLFKEYQISGFNVYISQKSDKSWVK
jgi:hypothetical protein